MAIVFLFLSGIFNLYAGETYSGHYDGAEFEFQVFQNRIEGVQGQQSFRFYYAMQGIFGRDISGKDIDLYFKENNIWGKSLCGDIDLYQDSKSFVITGYFCGKRIKQKSKVRLIESQFLEDAFFKNHNIELKGYIKESIYSRFF